METSPANEIEQNLLNWYLSIDDHDHIYAKHDKTHGRFDMELMEVQTFTDESELDRIEQGIEIIGRQKPQSDLTQHEEELVRAAWQYIQTYNHELCHYYQALALPAFQILQIIRRQTLKFEAVTMLSYFESGGSYVVGDDKKLLQPLSSKNWGIPTDEIHAFNELCTQYKFYRDAWKEPFKGVSLYAILESMAHVLSIQLTDTATNYIWDLEQASEYTEPFNAFLREIEPEGLESRWQYLLFLYICYFSCQNMNHWEDDDSLLPARIFHALTGRADHYLTSLAQLVSRYEKYTKPQLIQLLQFGITPEDVEEATVKQIGSVLGFFELIPCIQQDAEKLYGKRIEASTPFISHLKSQFERQGMDVTDPYLLAHLVIFPKKYGEFSNTYEDLGTTTIDEQPYDLETENNFYRLIKRCRDVLDMRQPPIECCEKHGPVENLWDLLCCTSEDGLATYLERLTGRPAIELFALKEI